MVNCGGFKFCCSSAPKVRNVESCGRSSFSDDSFTDRIIGGLDAKLGQFPWMVHVVGPSFHCGGVLVSHRHIITAQHCMDGRGIGRVKIVLGGIDFMNKAHDTPPIIMRALRSTPHPLYLKASKFHAAHYDIAIVELDGALDEYPNYVSPICLPSSHLNVTNVKGFVSGWGRTVAGNRASSSNSLKFTELKILDNDSCMQMHEQHLARSIAMENLKDDVICAYSDDRDACQGDSGGPLFIKHNGVYTVVGLVQTGIGCAEFNRPGIYHRVSSSSNWISSVIFG